MANICNSHGELLLQLYANTCCRRIRPNTRRVPPQSRPSATRATKLGTRRRCVRCLSLWIQRRPLPFTDSPRVALPFRWRSAQRPACPPRTSQPASTHGPSPWTAPVSEDSAFALCVPEPFMAKTVPLPCVFQSLLWRRQCLCLVCSTAFRGEDSAFALCVPLLFVAKTVPLPFVFQSLPRLKHCLSLRFPGDYTACKAYATGQLHFDWACLLPPCAALGVYQTSATGLSFYAVSAFFYTANGIEPPGGLVGLSGPGQALSLASIEAAGMAYCTRHWATILNASSSNGTYEAAYCFSASYIVALLGTGAALNSQLVVHIMLRPSALALDVCRPVPALIFPTPCRLRAPSCCLLRADCSAPCSPLPHPTCRSQLPSTRECTAALSEHPFPIAARVGCPQGTSLTRRTITP